MKKKDIKKIVESWFKNKRLKINLKENLFKSNKIDSFDVIDLISFLEKKFNINFNADEVQDPNFPIIENILNKIEEKINVK